MVRNRVIKSSLQQSPGRFQGLSFALLLVDILTAKSRSMVFGLALIVIYTKTSQYAVG